MSSLSLVMVVKDAADLLAAFFPHHEQLADEVVVVDTGSVDDTVDVAKAAGAKVLDFTWCDDFAAARNQGLRKATREWIIILDADERISRQDLARLRNTVLPSEPTCVWLQETINYSADPGHLEWRPVRGLYPREESGQRGYFLARRVGVFPRRDDVRFSGRVHESVLPAAQRAGLRLEKLPIPVHHYGYVLSAADNKSRLERYARLVALKHADDPADPASQLELATVRLEEGRPDLACPLLEQLAAGTPDLRPVVRGLFLLGRLRREQGNLEAAGKLLQKAVRGDPSFVFGWLELVRLLAGQGRWSEAARALEQAKRHTDPEDPLLLKEELRYLVKVGQVKRARIIAGRLVEIYPSWADIRALHDRLQKISGRLD